MFRLLRAVAEVTPCIKEGKVIAETLVDVADEVKKGTIVYSTSNIQSEKPDQAREANSMGDNHVSDLSLAVLSKVLDFTQISFQAARFRSLLAESGTIQLGRYLIAPSEPSINVNLGSLAGLPPGPFLDARLIIEQSQAVLMTPGVKICDPAGKLSHIHSLPYSLAQVLTIGNSAWQVRSRPYKSLTAHECPLVNVDSLPGTSITFGLRDKAEAEFSICIVNT